MADSKTLFTPPNPSDLMNPKPFRPHRLAQLRAGKVKSVFNLPIKSAIHKIPIHEPTQITELGIPTDEHDFVDHGGLDKAFLHYCSAHYEQWKQDLPGSAHLFSAGAFGENLVSSDVNEKTVCIGDKILIGSVIIQASEPRAPCYKLNHRFEISDMAKRAQMLFRTGWYCRVLRTGVIAPGDTIELLERPHPEWTVARVQYYLYHEKNNMEIMKEMVEIAELARSTKKVLRGRLEKGVENQVGRLFGDSSLAVKTWSDYRIVEKKMETIRVASFVLEAVEPVGEELAVEPGSHVRVKLGGKLVRAYSVVGGSNKRFELGIALDVQSRGGSKFLHEQTKVGDVLTMGRITTSFPLAKEADHHITIAGGIGLTAFLAALKCLQKLGQSYEFHLAVASDVPFQRYITPLGDKAKIYNKSQGKCLNIRTVISRVKENTHVYCCGPQRLMDDVGKAAKDYGMPESQVHFETFQVATSGDPFTAELKESKKTIEVGGDQTLLDALRATGMDIESSCEVGNCGTCRVSLCSGRVEHRGTGLMEQEKKTTILSCVSRGVGHIVLEL
ncbi:3-chlorobenzoate-3,4-dioxygenase reductase subunit [Zopfia rhizophila CBS 207.26]|uniref:3-chlorobenzoate-3,4-dioxygenase reductase subunit n=1 Tax=Zopfia rhizophila CBS 207.26 TaxID=1314779 RepID=A0A6A6ETB1_9PEZI|nr:3-chlorobenzoate-3,4-dioxygenase reductase subunit [Zopfia rhizophila CBS 207.26]